MLEQYKAKVNAFAVADGNMTTVDMYSSLADANGPIMSLWDADGAHLNREGYAILGQYMRTALGITA